MITGGSEAAITGLTVGGFANMKALSDAQRLARDGQPPVRQGPRRLRAGRRRRDRGAREPRARRSAAAPASCGEVLGYGVSGDAYHITVAAPSTARAPSGPCATAWRTAGSSPSDVGYINAHGTSTPQGDVAETEAVKAVFGEQARKLVFGSTKSMTGHLLGGAGALEFGVSLLLASTCGVIPPTINQFTPDPECDLDCAPNRKVERRVDVALSNSFGFGGHNVTLAVRRWEA